MLFVDNEGITDPRLNLALEEYLLRHVQPHDDIVLFYVNEPSVIIGRNQNTLEEINPDYVAYHGIHVVRRLSGGGAVYHDLGNLNFSFITRSAGDNIHNFRKFTAPVIRVLQALGVPAELGGRNDIVAGGRKISGNAQYIAAARMVSHGTLLFDADLSHVSAALNAKPGKLESKAIKSVRSRVANIREFLQTPMDLPAFRARLLQGIFAGSDTIPQYQMSPADWQAVRALAGERYMRWEWNYGRSPDFNVQKTRRFPGGEIDARIDVAQGTIRNIRFFGDYFGYRDVEELERRLTGVRYDPHALAEALGEVDVADYFAGVTREEFVQLLY